MNESRIEVETPDGRADGVLFVPAGDGPWHLVVQFMDAGGLRPAMTELARPLVEAGYAVFQPNLYWRAGDYAPFDPKTVFGDPAERARLGVLMQQVTPARVADDLGRQLVALQADPRIRADRLRLVGYCIGGRMVFCMAQAFGDRVLAGAAIHAGHLVTDAPDSPHRSVDRTMKAWMYFAVADEDASFTPEHQQAVSRALDAADVDHTIEVYAGARHGFAMSDFPVYDAAACRKQWDRVLALFESV